MDYYLVERLSYQDIVDRGFQPDTVRWVIQAIDRSEYKRRQAAPGLKIASQGLRHGAAHPHCLQIRYLRELSLRFPFSVPARGPWSFRTAATAPPEMPASLTSP